MPPVPDYQLQPQSEESCSQQEGTETRKTTTKRIHALQSSTATAKDNHGRRERMSSRDQRLQQTGTSTGVKPSAFCATIDPDAKLAQFQTTPRLCKVVA